MAKASRVAVSVPFRLVLGAVLDYVIRQAVGEDGAVEDWTIAQLREAIELRETIREAVELRGIREAVK